MCLVTSSGPCSDFGQADAIIAGVKYRAHFFVGTSPQMPLRKMQVTTRRRRRRPGCRAQQSLCFFRRRSPIGRQRQVSGSRILSMARGNERGRSAGPLVQSPSSRTATAVPARVTPNAMWRGWPLCPAELHDAASPVRVLGRLQWPIWKSNAATGKASCAATARASANGLCVSEALKRPLPAPFARATFQGTRVNSLSLVRYRTNDYSVPVAFGHQDVWIRGYVHEVVIGCGAGSIARHPRSYDREDMRLRIAIHYLPLLEHKIGAPGSGRSR